LLAASLSTALGLALAEIALRIGWQNPYAEELPETTLTLPIAHGGTNRCFSRGEIAAGLARACFRTDARGYVLPSRRFQKPNATVAFLGGSTTECYAVAEGLRFPALASTLLEANGWQVDTLNAGRSGNTSHDALNVLLNHVVADAPDVAVFMEATNDGGLLGLRGSYAERMGAPSSLKTSLRHPLQKLSSYSSVVALVRIWATITRLQADSGRFQHPQNTAASKVADPRPFEQRLRAFVGICRAFGIVPVLMTQPITDARNGLTPDWSNPHSQDVFNAAIRKVGAEERVHVIDLVRHLVEEVPGWNAPMRYFYDGLHVNDEGSRLYAKFIAAELQRDVLPGLRR
jgi:lysophospholipase L1-like esterase